MVAEPSFDRSDVVNAFTTLITPAAQGSAGREAAIATIEDARAQRLALEARTRAAVWQSAMLEQPRR